MKLFNRGQAAAAGPASTQAVAPPVEPRRKNEPAAAPAPGSAPAAAPATPATPPAPAAPDVAELLESSVKDISEKVARLASTVESTGAERESFEAKLSVMEERMRKLSSLTEMISAQYNPFVGDAPETREPLPTAEAGLAAPALGPAEMSEFRGTPAGASLGLHAPALDEPEAHVEEDAMPFETAPWDEPSAPAHEDEHAGPSVQVDRFGSDFQSSLILLKWADLLIQNTQSREGVADLCEYYHNIGWLGTHARDQLLAYADGIAFDEPAHPAGEWRATAEFHEISLLFLEKLKNLNRGAR